jgi:hypothetical protein
MGIMFATARAVMNKDHTQTTEKLPKGRIALIVVIIACAFALGIASATSTEIESSVEPFMALLAVIGLGAYAVANAARMVIDFRERRYQWAALWLLAALILAGMVIAALHSVFGR